jgi:phosphate transport system substrate-binding protein
MRRFVRLALVCACFAFTFALAEVQDRPELPPYQPQQQVSGRIRITGHGAIGHDYIASLVKAWEEGFARTQPGVTFDTQLVGTASAIGSLYAGTADLALMGREIWPMELTAFDEVFHYPPLGVDVVTGSYDVRNKDFALVVFVNKENPLQHLTFAQIDAIFDAEHRTSPKSIHTWGELGLTGEWKDKPIHTLGFPISRGFGYYMEQTVFGGSRKWTCDLKEFPDVRQPDGKLLDGGQQILDALAQDKYAIGYASMFYKNAGVKPLALKRGNADDFVAVSRDSVMDHTYPLTRVISVYLNRAPGTDVDPKLKEFMRYILSREGQAAAEQDGGYLPLTPTLAERERHKLD